MKHLAVLIIMLAGMGTWSVPSVRAQQASDDLGEAAGLGASSPAVTPDAGPGRNDGLRWRAYGLIDWQSRKTMGRDKPTTSGANFEAGAAVDLALNPSVAVFAEGRGLYDNESDHRWAVLDQGGIRLKAADAVMLAVGKERNRRAPGMIVSPSDFIHSNQSIPGMREERSGVWLGRLSWQTEVQTADLLALPVSHQKESGLPEDDSEYLGTAVRYFRRLPGGIDLGIDAGKINDEARAGAFAQTIWSQVWKLYGETGYDDATESSSHLIGAGYEGSSTWAVKAEWYGRDEDWIPPMILLRDRSYAILSASALDILDRFNFTDTVLRSLENEQYMNLLRAEWLVGDQNTAGMTLITLEPDVPFSWQAMVDWKISF